MPPAISGILLDAFKLKPVDAIKYLKSKGYAVSWNWYDTWKEAHAKAFTVAKATRMDVLQAIREEVEKALEEGRTLAQFKKDLTQRLKALGWWGITTDDDGNEVRLGTPWRLRTIYRTNIQTAYSAGRYKQQRAVATARPYWQYIAVMDSKTRAAHRALHGKVLRADDPAWDTIYPPNGWGCRCRVRTLSQRDIDRRKLTVEPVDTKRLVTREVPVGSGDTKHLVKVTGYTTTTGDGQPITMWPDAGWDYNNGSAAWQPNLNAYDTDVARQYVVGAVTGPAFRLFFESPAPMASMPVAVIDEAYQTAVSASTHTVALSGESLTKNKRAHPDLSLAEYQQLPRIVGTPDMVVQDGERTMVFLQMGDLMYHAALKATRTGAALFLTSFRRTYMEDVERISKRGTVLWNHLGGR